MSDEETHSEHEHTRGENELDKALNEQRSIFLDELETRQGSTVFQLSVHLLI
jgi:hypothetical protein